MESDREQEKSKCKDLELKKLKKVCGVFSLKGCERVGKETLINLGPENGRG